MSNESADIAYYGEFLIFEAYPKIVEIRPREENSWK